jgi:hypothetical protein
VRPGVRVLLSGRDRPRASILDASRVKTLSGGEVSGQDRVEARRPGNHSENVVALAAHTEIGGRSDPLSGVFRVPLGLIEPFPVPECDDHDLTTGAVVLQADEASEVRVMGEHVGDAVEGVDQSGVIIAIDVEAENSGACLGTLLGRTRGSEQGRTALMRGEATASTSGLRVVSVKPGTHAGPR